VPRLERCRSVSDELRIGVDMLAEQPESTVIAVKLVAESPCGSSLSSTLQSLNSLRIMLLLENWSPTRWILHVLAAPRTPPDLQWAQHHLTAQTSTQMLKTSNSTSTIPNTSTANATESYSSQTGMIAPQPVRSQVIAKWFIKVTKSLPSSVF
jgi:hypothetical protein